MPKKGKTITSFPRKRNTSAGKPKIVLRLPVQLVERLRKNPDKKAFSRDRRLVFSIEKRRIIQKVVIRKKGGGSKNITPMILEFDLTGNFLRKRKIEK